jgi:transcriptional regulator with XRE-family HTH domain
MSALDRRRTAQAFGAVLARRRQARGLSQEALAHATGLDRTYVSLLERGRRQPTLDVLLRLAGALGCPAAALLAAVEGAPCSARRGEAVKDLLAQALVQYEHYARLARAGDYAMFAAARAMHALLAEAHARCAQDGP